MEKLQISSYISIQRPNDEDLVKFSANENIDIKTAMQGITRKITSTFLTSFAFMGPLIFTGYEDGLICCWYVI